MKLLKKVLLSLGIASAIGFSGAASAIPFTVTSGGFSVGSGYGTGNGQLDVTFTNLITSPVTFNLNAPGDVGAFLFGRAELKESCINSGSTVLDLFLGCGFGGDETNNLGVTANLTFTDPVSTLVQNVAVTGAFAGPVNDPFIQWTDFFIDFSPVTINFGTTGSFDVDIADLYFNQNGPITTAANVTLTSLPVPEPGSLALLGLGLLGLVRGRRRTQKA